MHYDAQILMIVSTLKLAQTLAVDPDTGKAGMRYVAKCHGGCKSSHLQEQQAVVEIQEAARLEGRYVGQVLQRNGNLQISMRAPREYFNGIISLFPHCLPEQGGYLSFNFLLSSEVEMSQHGPLMRVMSAEYKMVKELSSNPDLISRN